MGNSELVTLDQQQSLPAMAEPHMRLIEMAVSSGADISKLEKLMDLQERYEANKALKAFNIAMSIFQSILPVIEKLGVVDYTPINKGRTYYRYAKLEDIAAAIRGPLKETGLSYRFDQKQVNGTITVSCIITHKDGHYERNELSCGVDTSGGKDAIKGTASTISYLRRYTLTGGLGIVVGGDDDDDGSADLSNSNEPMQVQCYPDTEFGKNYPAWSKKIKDGSHTVETLHKFLTGKNIILSQSQYDKLQQVGK